MLANGRLGYSMAPDDLITVTGQFEEEEPCGDTDQILMSIGQQKRTLTWRERKEKEVHKSRKQHGQEESMHASSRREPRQSLHSPFPQPQASFPQTAQGSRSVYILVQEAMNNAAA